MPDSEQPLPSLISYMRQHRFAGLLAALMLLFFYGAIADLFTTNLKPIATRVTFGTIITVLLLSAVFSVSRSRKTFRNAMILGVPAIIFEVLDVCTDSTPIRAFAYVLSAIFLSHVIVVLLKFIFVSKRVTANTIFASLCVYLLVGTVWAMAYAMLETCQPGAFWYSLASNEDNNPEDSTSVTINAMRLGEDPAGLEFYYSFVTMTTLGYGDIVPVTAAARGLATLQALVGQLYLAVLVARLVGLHVAESVRRKE